ncbi:MAG: zinc-binding dehydrogenase [Deltaproteobacteria bacterium]|nr:zinc-binding dehydrogenase [Deltaproteobacteria bacterium]
MKAAILHELGKPLVIDEVELPQKLGVGQVLVKVLFSGICGSQIGEINGVKGEDRFLPHLLGHEGSGEVIETGPGVWFVKQGDKVVLHWRKGAGIDAGPPVYSWKGKRLNAGFVTTFNEYAVVSENRLTKIPAGMPMDIAPLMGCAVTTGLGVINNNARVKIGESIVILGAGGVGLNIVQGAAMCSAHPVVAVDIHDNRLEMASRFGATHTINSYGKTGFSDNVYEIVGTSGADVVIDNTGITDMINLAYKLTKPDGRTILVGVPKKGDNISIYSLDLHFDKIITGSHGGETDPGKDIPRYGNLYKNGKLNLDDLVTDRFSLDEINLAIEKMKNGKSSGRCLIQMHV